MRVAGPGVRVGCGVGVARGVGVGVGEGVGDGVGVGVNDGSGRGVKVSDALGLGLVDGATGALPGTIDRAAPATIRPTTVTTSAVATTFPHMKDVWRRNGVVEPARAGGTIGSVGSRPRVLTLPMLARRSFVGRCSLFARLRPQVG